MWANGQEVLLVPKTLNLLVFLTKHPNLLFSREELVEALWRGVYVDDHALSVQIVELRRFLGDNPKAPRYIETRARLGYRFLLQLAPPALIPVVLPAVPIRSGDALYTKRAVKHRLSSNRLRTGRLGVRDGMGLS